MGVPGKKILEYAIYARNKAKVDARAMMTKSGDPQAARDVAKLGERNIKKYGNPYGPTLEDFSYSSIESYQSILQSAFRGNPMLNALFIAW